MNTAKPYFLLAAVKTYFYFPFSGCIDHASVTTHRPANIHVTPRPETEYSYTKRTDIKECSVAAYTLSILLMTTPRILLQYECCCTVTLSRCCIVYFEAILLPDQKQYIRILKEQLGRIAQSVGHLTCKSGVLGSIPGLATYRFSFRFFKKGNCQLLAKVCARSTGNGLGGLILPRKSVVRLTDRPDMTLDVYCGRKTTIQQLKELISKSALWQHRHCLNVK